MSQQSKSLTGSYNVAPGVVTAIEEQLTRDLKFHGVEVDNLVYDWSECEGEGHTTIVLDSRVQNYSNVAVHGSNGQLVAAGWVDFLEDRESGFVCFYWQNVKIYDGDKILFEKSDNAVPKHLFENLPTYPSGLRARLETQENKQP